ncbi:MAG: (deoxy)nucleoside triphosphate pyrophosphohydrolase [Akkermansiaceae bacterium]
MVCAVIEDEANRLLACRRADGKVLAGKWEFPGGKIEIGESPEIALLREIAEELGCEVDIVQRLPDVTHAYTEFSIRLMPFLCKLVSGEPHPLEHSEVKWIDLAECDGLDWAEADIPIWLSLEGHRRSLTADGDTFSE